MAKVLISHFSGVFDVKWETTVFYEGLINSLTRNGNEVLHLVSNDFITSPWAGKENKYISGINTSSLIAKIKAFNPDFVICFNNSTIPELDKILECPIFIWDADASYYFCDLERLKSSKDRYRFLSFSHSGVHEIQQNLGVLNANVFLLPAATDIRNNVLEKLRNIVFIGSNFKTEDSLKKELLRNPELRQKCLHSFKDSNNDFQSLVQSLRSIPPETLKMLSMIQSANLRVKALDAVSDLGLEIFGTPSWIQLIDFSVLVALSYNDRKVYTQVDNENIYNSSNIGFSISHNQSKTGFPWRIYDIMASDACLVADYKEDLFIETKGSIEHLPLYKNSDEARKLCQKILADNSFRREVVDQSNRYIEKNCRFEIRFHILEQILNIKLVANSSPGSYHRLIPEQTVFGAGFNRALVSFSRFIPFEYMKMANRLIFKRLGIKAPSSLVKKIQHDKGETD